MISYELVVEIYKEAESTGLYDWWDCNAYVVDKLLTEVDRKNHPSFYHSVYIITDWTRKYVASTHGVSV